MAGLSNISIETSGTEEEAAENQEVVLGMASQEMGVEEDRDSKGEDEGGGTQRALGYLEFLTQEAELRGAEQNYSR